MRSANGAQQMAATVERIMSNMQQSAGPSGGSRQEAVNNSLETVDEDNEMERGLTNRHVQFIAIGGAIGTGLFLGSGKSIALDGPSIVLVYILVGGVMFLMMRAIGELMYRDPSQHTFINFIRMYLGNGTGKFALWTYWLVLILTGMTELSAVGQYCVTFFHTLGFELKSWQWLIELLFLAALVSVNLIAVKLFGETEFWFSMIKIFLILALIVTSIIMVVAGYRYGATKLPGSGQTYPAGQASLANISDGFSLAPNGWTQMLMSFQMVFFSYTMIEFVGVTVSETKNPRKVLPKAINGIILRVLVFYVGALLAIMAIVPWRNFMTNDNSNQFSSPFIMVFEFAGLHWAAAVVFFVVLTAAASSLNSLLYSAGRHLFQIGEESKSPTLSKLGVVSKTKVPARAIVVSGALIVLSPAIAALPGASGAFVLFSSAASAVFIFIYILTMVAHYRYRNSPQFMADGFLMPAYRVLNPLTIVFFVFIYATLFIGADTRGPAIAGLVWLVVFGGYCLLHDRYSSRGLRAALKH